MSFLFEEDRERYVFLLLSGKTNNVVKDGLSARPCLNQKLQ